MLYITGNADDNQIFMLIKFLHQPLPMYSCKVVISNRRNNNNKLKLITYYSN